MFDCSRYIFYINIDGSFSVCKEAFWNENGFLDDRHDRELCSFLNNRGFREIRTNQYAKPEYHSTQSACALLKDMGFKEIPSKALAPSVEII